MRIAVHASAAQAGARVANAIEGLAARGHHVDPPGGATRARTECDVVIGAGRALGPAWLAALTRARVLVLALEAGVHRTWGAVDRWAWGMSGGYGIVATAEVPEFLAQVSAGERERLALWPEAPPPSPPSTHADTEVLERLCERSLARRSAGPGRSALFLDRDGTVIVERDHLSDPAGVELLPGVAEALRVASTAGHPLVLVSNQAGVGRGIFPETRVHEVMARLRRLLRAEGVELDSVRFCPHAPEAGCDCRKPGTRLLREAADDLRISLPGSLMVGDKWIDVAAGLAVGATSVLVRTGHGAAELAAERPAGSPAADRVADDLPAAVRWYLSRLD